MSNEYKKSGAKMGNDEEHGQEADDALRLTGEIVSAYLGNNQVPSSEVPNVIKSVYGALAGLTDQNLAGENPPLTPAIPISQSITDEFIICLEDGKKLKMLKRYLRSNFSLTPEEYRSKWNLPADYPMVAPNYAAQRSEFAKKIGLGKGSPPRR